MSIINKSSSLTSRVLLAQMRLTGHLMSFNITSQGVNETGPASSLTLRLVVAIWLVIAPLIANARWSKGNNCVLRLQVGCCCLKWMKVRLADEWGDRSSGGLLIPVLSYFSLLFLFFPSTRTSFFFCRLFFSCVFFFSLSPYERVCGCECISTI